MLAKSENISLVQLRKPKEADWTGRIRELPISLHMIIDEVFGYSATLGKDGEDQNELSKYSTHELQVDLENGDSMGLTEIADRVRKMPAAMDDAMIKRGIEWTLESPTSSEVRAFVVKFPTGTFLTHPQTGCNANLTELKFKVRGQVIDDNVHIDFRNYVSWIMEAVFEGRKFAITPDRLPIQWD